MSQEFEEFRLPKNVSSHGLSDSLLVRLQSQTPTFDPAILPELVLVDSPQPPLPTREQVLDLVRQLDSTDSKIRQQAQRDLQQMGPSILPFLTDVHELGREPGWRLGWVLEECLREYGGSLRDWEPGTVGSTDPTRIPPIISLLPGITPQALQERRQALEGLNHILNHQNVQLRGLLPQPLEFYRQSVRFQLEELNNLPGVRAWLDNITKISLGRTELIQDDHKDGQRDLLTDDKLKGLAGLTNLLQLNLSGTSVSDGGLQHLSGFLRLQKLDLSFCNNITGPGLKPIGRLTALEALFLYGTRIGDDGLSHLRGLTNLRILDLDKTGISDNGLIHMQGLTNLERLSLAGNNITDAGLVHLQGLTNLQRLSLSSTKITDAGLVHLQRLTNLQEVSLAGNEITNAGLVHLKGLAQLTHLSLAGTAISDEGLVHLKGLAQLTHLSLEGTAISQKGLVHLAAMKSLKTLVLAGTSIREEELAELRRELPGCEIIR